MAFDSAPDAGIAAMLVQFDESGLYLREKAGRDEAVAEYPGATGQRDNPGIRPFIV